MKTGVVQSSSYIRGSKSIYRTIADSSPTTMGKYFVGFRSMGLDS